MESHGGFKSEIKRVMRRTAVHHKTQFYFKRRQFSVDPIFELVVGVPSFSEAIHIYCSCREILLVKQEEACGMLSLSIVSILASGATGGPLCRILL